MRFFFPGFLTTVNVRSGFGLSDSLFFFVVYQYIVIKRLILSTYSGCTTYLPATLFTLFYKHVSMKLRQHIPEDIGTT